MFNVKVENNVFRGTCFNAQRVLNNLEPIGYGQITEQIIKYLTTGKHCTVVMKVFKTDDDQCFKVGLNLVVNQLVGILENRQYERNEIDKVKNLIIENDAVDYNFVPTQNWWKDC